MKADSTCYPNQFILDVMPPGIGRGIMLLTILVIAFASDPETARFYRRQLSAIISHSPVQLEFVHVICLRPFLVAFSRSLQGRRC